LARRNSLGVMEDPVKAMVLDAVSLLLREFTVHRVEVGWGRDELRITLLLRPRREGVSVPAWRIIELEDRIAEALGLKPDLSHSRVSVTPDGLLVLLYSYRVPGIWPPEAPPL
jgi:hypothetical protein